MGVRRNRVLLVTVSLVGGFGSTAMSLTAAVWVKTLTGSSGLAALAGFFVFAPTLLGPAFGTIVDRVPPRIVLVVTDLGMAALLLTLLTVRSAGQVWLVYAVMLGYGVSYVLVGAAESRMLAAALPPAVLGSTNGWRMSAREGTKLVAPLVGAGLFAWAGGAAVAAIASGTLVVSALLYRMVAITDPTGRLGGAGGADARPAWRRVWTDTVTGTTFLWTRRDLRVPVIVASMAMLLSGLGNASVYAVVDVALHRPPAFVGVLSSTQGAGAIAGGLLAGALLDRFGERVFAGVGAIVFALGPLAQAVGSLPAVIAGSALVGIGLPWTVVAALTAVQLRTPAPVLGRVAANVTTIVFAPPALGIPLGAALVSGADHRIPLALAAAGALVAGGVAVRPSRTPAARPRRRRARLAEESAPIEGVSA